MQIKNQLIVLSNNGTILHTEKHDIKQFENNFEFLILCNVFQGTTKGTISLSFSDEYPLQYATLRKEPYTYNGVEYDVYGWRGVQDLTLDAPRTISLSILADDYNNNIFSTLPITYNCIQSLQYNEVVGEPNSVESISFELNNTIAEIQNISGNIDKIVNGGITVDSAEKDSQGNIIHETYATQETVNALDERVALNENDIVDLKNEQGEQNDRLDAIESEQVTQNTSIERNRGNITANRNDINTNTSVIEEHDNLIESNRQNAESRIPKDLTAYNFKSLLQDNDVILIKQNDGNFKRILAKDLFTQAGTQTDLYKGQFISMEALILAYPEGVDHGFIAGTYATIDTVGKDTFNVVWDITDLKWVAADTSGFVSNVIYLLEQQEQNDKINNLNNTVNNHINDITRHITSAERSTWNDKPSNATFNDHANDTNIHITEDERTSWNGKVNEDDLTNLDLINEVALNNANLFNPFAFYEIGDYNSINEDGSLVLYSSAPLGTVRVVFVNAELKQTGNSSEVNGSAVTIPSDAFALYIYAGGDNSKYAKYEIRDLKLKGGDVVYISSNVREVNDNNIVVDKIMISKYDLPYYTFIEKIINNLTSTSTTQSASANMVRFLNEIKFNKSDLTNNFELADDVAITKAANAYAIKVLKLNKVEYGDIADNLTTITNNTVLSAKQGKILNEKINDLNDDLNDLDGVKNVSNEFSTNGTIKGVFVNVNNNVLFMTLFLDEVNVGVYNFTNYFPEKYQPVSLANGIITESSSGQIVGSINVRGRNLTINMNTNDTFKYATITFICVGE